MTKGATPLESLDGSQLRILIVHSRWNLDIVDLLLEGSLQQLRAHGVRDEQIVVRSVQGAWELPVAIQNLNSVSQDQVAKSSSSQAGATALDQGASVPPFDSIIALGCLIKGDTLHFEYISDAVAHGLMRIGLETGIPVIYGVLNVLTREQGLARAGQGSHNHAIDWAKAAIEMGMMKRRTLAGLL